MKKIRSIAALMFLTLVSLVWSQGTDNPYLAEVSKLSEGKRLSLAKESIAEAVELINKGQELGKAYNLLLKAEACDPTIQAILFEKGRLYEDWKVGLYGKTIELYEKYVESNPQDGRAMVHLAWNYIRIGSNEKAEDLYRRATVADPQNNWAWSEYARFLAERTTKYEEALAAADRASKAQPSKPMDNDPWLWRTKALALLRLKRTEEAKPALEKAFELFTAQKDSYQAGLVKAWITEFPF